MHFICLNKYFILKNETSISILILKRTEHNQLKQISRKISASILINSRRSQKSQMLYIIYINKTTINKISTTQKRILRHGEIIEETCIAHIARVHCNQMIYPYQIKWYFHPPLLLLLTICEIRENALRVVINKMTGVGHYNYLNFFFLIFKKPNMKIN